MVKRRNALVGQTCNLLGGFKTGGYYIAMWSGGGPCHHQLTSFDLDAGQVKNNIVGRNELKTPGLRVCFDDL